MIHARPGAGRVGLSFTRFAAPGVVVERYHISLDGVEGRAADARGRARKTRLDDVWVEPEGLEDLRSFITL